MSFIYRKSMKFSSCFFSFSITDRIVKKTHKRSQSNSKKKKEGFVLHSVASIGLNWHLYGCSNIGINLFFF